MDGKARKDREGSEEKEGAEGIGWKEGETGKAADGRDGE